MDFNYKDNILFAEGVSVVDLARRFGTPLYVYSRSHLIGQYDALAKALREVDPLICFSVKVNSNGAVVKTFAEQGAGADVVSGGELYRALKAGVDSSRIVFAGVGKTVEEIEYALGEEILFFTVESEPELDRISACARKVGQTARVALRVNPDVDPKTHKYISTGKRENKFGMDIRRLLNAYTRAAKLPNIEITGLHMHIGSQILSPKPYAQAVKIAVKLCEVLQKKYSTFRYLDLGGGLGIQYKPDQKPLNPSVLAKAIVPQLKPLGVRVVMEPGRYLVGNAGILVTQVQYIKQGPSKQFIVVDAAMNDLIRPPLYEAHHEIWPVKKTKSKVYGDVVGPICESADFLAMDRDLPRAKQGDWLAVMSAGAYGFSMASNYNSRGRAAEVMVSGKRVELVRERETIKDILRGERIPAW